jgi:hypothetical protein
VERLINSDSTITQLWSPITLRNPEDGGDTISKTLVLTTAIQYKVPEDIHHCYQCENIPEDSVL